MFGFICGFRRQEPFGVYLLAAPKTNKTLDNIGNSVSKSFDDPLVPFEPKGIYAVTLSSLMTIRAEQKHNPRCLPIGDFLDILFESIPGYLRSIAKDTRHVEASVMINHPNCLQFSIGPKPNTLNFIYQLRKIFKIAGYSDRAVRENNVLHATVGRYKSFVSDQTKLRIERHSDEQASMFGLSPEGFAIKGLTIGGGYTKPNPEFTRAMEELL